MNQENMKTQEIREKALLVGADTGADDNFERSMEELASLAEACGMQPVGVITQKMSDVNKTYYIGTGKLEEVKEFASTLEADIVLFDNALSPSQLRNLQKELGKPILDRTTLILDIFSKRAQTREAKLQVESARLQYMLPRLVGLHEALTRQGGASGSMSSKGAGEKKLELDRRKIEHRITELKKELEEVAKERETQSKRRNTSYLPQAALVGYTNAGKSTIMNRMVEAYGGNESKKVLEKDMLFATLETTVRKMEPGENRDFLLSDTVGFIHKLPHDLVKAFRSTLEEVRSADLLLHVVDYSDENYKQQMKVTEETLRELGAADIPVIYIYNKADKRLGYADTADLAGGIEKLPRIQGRDTIFISARHGLGIDQLKEMIVDKLYADSVRTAFLVPYDKGAAASYLMEHAAVKAQEYREDGCYIVADCSRADRERLAEYVDHTANIQG